MFNNFNRSAGDNLEAQQANWEGWTPPWMQGEGPGPRGGWGPHGPFGHGHGHHHGHGWGGPRGPFGRSFGFFGYFRSLRHVRHLEDIRRFYFS